MRFLNFFNHIHWPVIFFSGFLLFYIVGSIFALVQWLFIREGKRSGNIIDTVQINVHSGKLHSLDKSVMKKLKSNPTVSLDSHP